MTRSTKPWSRFALKCVRWLVKSENGKLAGILAQLKIFIRHLPKEVLDIVDFDLEDPLLLVRHFLLHLREGTS